MARKYVKRHPTRDDSDIGPQINWKRLRGRIYESRVGQRRFCEAAGISNPLLSYAIRGVVPVKLFVRYRVAIAARALGLDEGDIVYGHDPLVADFGLPRVSYQFEKQFDGFDDVGPDDNSEPENEDEDEDEKTREDSATEYDDCELLDPPRGEEVEVGRPTRSVG